MKPFLFTSSTPIQEPGVASVFSFGLATVLAMWLYMILVLVALPVDSLNAHAWAIAASMLVGGVLEWMRSLGHKNYATVFLILLTLAPLLYKFRHG